MIFLGVWKSHDLPTVTCSSRLGAGSWVYNIDKDGKLGWDDIIEDIADDEGAIVVDDDNGSTDIVIVQDVDM
jgi:hypothetical protein